MRTMEKSDIEIMLPYARSLAKEVGLLSSADDCSIGGLAAAHANWERRGRAWCTCDEKDPAFEQVYFNDLNTGSHGWLCVKCGNITQVG